MSVDDIRTMPRKEWLAHIRWCGEVYAARQRGEEPPPKPQPKSPRPVKPAKPTAGWIYFVRGDSDEITKIGMTRQVNLSSRISTMQSGSPIPLRIVKSMRAFDVAKVEAILHDRFESQRSHGEWFRISDAEMIEGCRLIVAENLKVARSLGIEPDEWNFMFFEA
jgi:hypothetical protein